MRDEKEDVITLRVPLIHVITEDVHAFRLDSISLGGCSEGCDEPLLAGLLERDFAQARRSNPWSNITRGGGARQNAAAERTQERTDEHYRARESNDMYRIRHTLRV